jgi:ABC-type nitrate/sulfonate/bicarbonate transport system substrate-binding protein
MDPDRSHRRWSWVGIAASAMFVAVAASTPGSAETMLTVGKANATSDAIIPDNVGDKLGIFKKRGLNLKIVD